jgi:general stress protein 26
MPVSRSILRMTDDERDAFLTTERTLRCATVSPEGDPHVVPLWFVWHDGAIWLNSLKRSRRARDLAAGSKVAMSIDAGEAYGELRGVVIYGRAADAEPGPTLDAVRAIFGEKYWGGVAVPELASHRWLVVRPERIVSWDFAKIPKGRDKRIEALEQG